jgi:transcriptional regulator with XRE-family HTH domain
MQGATKPAIDWKAVGRRVRELRGFEIVQARFARELGISQGQLSRYEQGKGEIGAEILLRLARRSEKTIEWLLTGKDEGIINFKSGRF